MSIIVKVLRDEDGPTGARNRRAPALNTALFRLFSIGKLITYTISCTTREFS